MSAGAKALFALLAAALLVALVVWLRAGGDAATASAARGPSPAEQEPVELARPRNDARLAAPDEVVAPAAPAEAEPASVPAPGGDAEVSGWLLVDGGPPPETIELRIVHDALGGDERDREEQRTAADGGFRFTGLAQDWSGVLVLDFKWSFVRPTGQGLGEQVRRFDAPQRSLQLEVFPVVCLRGRVVDCASGEPVPEAHVMVTRVAQDGTGMSAGARSDARGRFEATVGIADFQRVVVEVSQAGGDRASSAEFRGEDLGDGLDVGDVCLAAPREVAFLVTDAAGAGIAGAAGRVVSDSVLARADERGRGVLRGLPEGELLLRFAADGFRAAEATVAPGQPEVSVQLARGNRLTVRLTGDPAVVAAVALELHGPRALFTDTSGYTPDAGLREIPRHTGTVGGGNRERGYYVVPLDAGGRAELQALASADLELRAVDRLREPLAVLHVPPLGPEEQREAQLALDVELGAVRGRVLDEEGRALRGVTVHVHAVEKRGIAVDTTDGDGRFCIAPLAPGRVLVRLERDGFAMRVIEQVDARGAELELRMQRGLELAVEVRDPSGAPVQAEQVDAARLDRSQPDWNGVEQAPGSHQLRDVPPERLRVRAKVGGHAYEREHDPRDGPLRFEVPVHGALELTWDPPVGAGAVQVLATSPDDPTFELRWSAGFLPQTGTTIPALPPRRYTVQLRVWDGDAQEWRHLSRPTTVQVEAGRTTHAVLAP